jgi:hypothetical protein
MWRWLVAGTAWVGAPASGGSMSLGFAGRAGGSTPIIRWTADIPPEMLVRARARHRWNSPAVPVTNNKVSKRSTGYLNFLVRKS